MAGEITDNIYNVKIFLSYVRKEASYMGELRSRLQRSMPPEINLTLLIDDTVQGGDPWKEKLLSYVKDADIAILLITPRFLSSEWCLTESEWILKRNHQDSAFRAMPIHVKECPTSFIPKDLLALQILRLDKAVLDDDDVGKAWDDIARAVTSAATASQRAETAATQSAEAPIAEPDKNALKEVVQSGFFTPILGPSCHTAVFQGNFQEILSDRLCWLYEKVRDDDREWNYVKSVVRCKLDEWPLPEPPPEPTNRPMGFMLSLLDFQASIVRAAMEASRLFGKTLSEMPLGVEEPRSFEVSIGDRPRAREKFRRLLMELVSAAGSLEHLRKAALDKQLGVRGIRQQLEELIYRLFLSDIRRSRADEETKWRLNRILPDEKTIPIPQRQKLKLSDLQWLGDILWHTLRFQAPIYPSLSDLSIQLCTGLTSRPLPPRRESIGSVAAIVGDVLVERLKRYLHPYASSKGKVESASEQRSSRRVMFYESLAAAFGQCADKQSQRGESGSTRKNIETRLPVIINTNFDIEMERAFSRIGRPYNIAFPVHVNFDEATCPEDGIDWLIDTSSSPKEFSWSLLGEREMESLVDLQDSLNGPLIIKLHGSPLTNLPNPQSVDTCLAEYLVNAEITELTHRLILSEYDLLRLMIEKKSLPKGLRELLAANMLLCFFGFKISDFYNRVQFYDHVQDLDNPGLLLVDIRSGPVDDAMAETVGARLIQAPFSEIARVIGEAVYEHRAGEAE